MARPPAGGNLSRIREVAIGASKEVTPATRSVVDPYQPADDTSHDLGPWIEAPSSTRVRDYRYDYATGQLQVRWVNRPPTQGYVYQVGGGSVQTRTGGDVVGRLVFQRFARAVSKGKYINHVLDGVPYRPAEPDEIQAPSNPDRRALSSRVIR